MALGKHQDYSIYPYTQDSQSNQNFYFGVRDKLFRNFYRIGLGSNVKKLNGIDLVANLFLLPKEELIRLLPFTEGSDDQIKGIFLLYCDYLKKMIGETKSEYFQSGNVYVKYKDIPNGIDILSTLINGDPYNKHKHLGSNHNRIFAAITYLRSHRDNFLQFVIDKTNSDDPLEFP